MELLHTGTGKVYEVNIGEGDFQWEYAIELDNDHVLLIGTDHDDGYRSYMIEKEIPRLEFIYMSKELKQEYNSLEIYKNDPYYIVADGYVIGEYGTDYSDSWYPQSIVGFDFESKETVEEYLKKLHRGECEEEEIYELPKALEKNKEVCYVVLGEPRTGKTTSMLEMKKEKYVQDVCDTDMFEKPIDVITHIKGGTAYVIGKHRNEIMRTSNKDYTYEEFLTAYIKRLGYDVVVLDFKERTEVKENEVYKIFMTFASNVVKKHRKPFPYPYEKEIYDGNKINIFVKNG